MIRLPILDPRRLRVSPAVARGQAISPFGCPACGASMAHHSTRVPVLGTAKLVCAGCMTPEEREVMR